MAHGGRRRINSGRVARTPLGVHPPRCKVAGDGSVCSTRLRLALARPFANTVSKTKEVAMKFDIPTQKKQVFEMLIPIRWGDMDAMGHVNNTTYFRYLETIRIDWMRAVGAMPNPLGEGPVIVNAFCNFYKQLEYPGDVRVKMFTSDPARTTFETWGTMEMDDQPGVIYAAGGATTIWVDFPKQKAIEMPDWLRSIVS